MQSPIVISLDVHGILTDRTLKQISGIAIYHTYPQCGLCLHRAAGGARAVPPRHIENLANHYAGGDPGAGMG